MGGAAGGALIGAAIGAVAAYHRSSMDENNRERCARRHPKLTFAWSRGNRWLRRMLRRLRKPE